MRNAQPTSSLACEETIEGRTDRLPFVTYILSIQSHQKDSQTCPITLISLSSTHRPLRRKVRSSTSARESNAMNRSLSRGMSGSSRIVCNHHDLAPLRAIKLQSLKADGRPATPVPAHDQLAFVGLGAMGKRMATNLARYLQEGAAVCC